jgi:hypothetical protein
MTDWQSDDQIRFVELSNPAGGCLFPSTRLEVFDAEGQALAFVSPVTVTTCVEPGEFFVFAPPMSADFLGIVADESVLPVLPESAGQVCLASSQIRYDCVRWGDITTPVLDFFGQSDTTTAALAGPIFSISRTQNTHVIIDDWSSMPLSPGEVNDGEPWTPVDAGPEADAGATPDGGTLDAGSLDAGLSDAGPAPDAFWLPDAGSHPDSSRNRFLDLDPAGGATCGCASNDEGSSGFLSLLLMLSILLIAMGRKRPSTKS